MTLSPAYLNHWEIFQSIPAAPAHNDSTFYWYCVEEHGMCPWLCAAAYHATNTEELNYPLAISCLNADHSEEAYQRRERALRMITLKEKRANLTEAITAVRLTREVRPPKNITDSRRRSLLLYQRLYHWERICLE